ncbi:MAG: sigma factor-like helix-turn-helix DNA-binding protein [Bacillota bacterium]|nr:sigma factor-like helix-turn-helix DNA-binding protein [Bacillota bacterium]
MSRTEALSHAELTLRLDLYGELLQGRAAEVLDLYLNEDLSLGEIGERMGISRQAVHDASERGRRRLEQFENVLGLAAKHRRLQQELDALEERLDAGDLAGVREQLQALRETLEQ